MKRQGKPLKRRALRKQTREDGWSVKNESKKKLKKKKKNENKKTNKRIQKEMDED